jgi:hypothetical protein
MSGNTPRRIIYIAGANHSGSTLAGCILGAHPAPFTYFHVGEIHAYFRRTRRAYLIFRRTIKSFGDPKAARKANGGEIWDAIDPEVGYQNAYREIFEKSGAEIIIDSSKKPHHFRTAARACKKNRWPLHVVITFRPFAKIWQSDLNRENLKLSIIKNIHNYVELKEKIIDSHYPWTILNVEQLILNPPDMTRALCDAVGVPYFEGKERYWNYPGCHLYGSLTQRRHMKNPKNAGYDASKVATQAHVEHPFLKEKRIQKVEQFLANHAVSLPA